MLKLDNDQVDLIIAMTNFVEENWSAFIQRCEERGISEEELEFEINKMKEELQ